MDLEIFFEGDHCSDEGMRLRNFFPFRDLRDYFSRIKQKSPDDDLDLVRFLEQEVPRFTCSLTVEMRPFVHRVTS